MSISKTNLKAFLFLSLSVILVWCVASNFIIPLYYYNGMNDLKLDISFFYSLFFLIYFLFLILSLKYKSSTDFFLATIFFLCVFNSNIFYSVSGITDSKLVLIKNLIFFIFFFILYNFNKLSFKLNFQIPKNLFGVVNLKVEVAITILLIVLFVIVYQKLNLSFSAHGNYEFRIDGRDKIKGLLGYYWNGGLNGLAPILGFISIYNKRFSYYFFAIAFALAGYAFIGVKTSISLVIFMGYLGWFFSNTKNSNFLKFFYLIFFFSSLICLLEYLFFNQSYVGDYFIRRIFLTVSQNQMYFIEFISTNLTDFKSIIFGLYLDKSESFVIGNLYYNNELSNANSNTFLSEIIRNGLVGFFINLIFIIFFLSFSNYCFRVTKHHVWFALPTLYALLIFEQNYKTAFLSSGVLFTIILLFIFKNKRFKKV